MANYLTISKNSYKKTDKHPDLRAFISINEALEPGVYEAGLFSKISQNGNKIYNGTIKPKFDKGSKPVEHWQEKKEENIEENNDIPF